MTKLLGKTLRQGLLFEDDEGLEPLIGWFARVFILGSLPHSRPDDNEFERSFGVESFKLHLLSPRDVGLPYGRIPRLILARLTTQAVREKTPELGLASSFSDFCWQLGVPPTGGANGYLTQVKNQLVRLVHLTVQATWDTTRKRKLSPDEERIYSGNNFQLASDYFFPWESKSPRSGPLSLRLSDEFFRLIAHKPVPVDFGTLQKLQSSFAMDVYILLTWRAMRALRRGQPEPVTWMELKRQLGADYGRLRDLRAKFAKHLKTVIRHYPSIRVELTQEALIIHPYRPHVARLRSSPPEKK